MLKLNRFIYLIILLCLTMDNIQAQTLIRRDDFQNRKSYWFWRADGNAMAPRIIEGLAEIKLENPINTTYCNSEIMDPENLFHYKNVRMRVKAAVPKKPGSRGWGWWHTSSPVDEEFFDLAWYVDQTDGIQQSEMTWWRLWAGNAAQLVTYKDLDGIADTGQWHLYEVKWNQEDITYWLDNDLIHTETTHIPDANMSFHIWVDNKIYALDGQTNLYNWTGESSLLIDFVEYSTADHMGVSLPAQGSVKLREIPNQIGWGESTYLLKLYSYKSPGGLTAVLVHGRAEKYQGLSEDDDIKLIIDGQDYGWDTGAALDGDRDNGLIKTLVISVTQTPGTHTVSLMAQTTPTLYDVTVIGDTQGNILALDTLMEQADGGINHLWKQYNFTSNAGYFTFYIAGWADEDTSGQQKLEFDDNLDDDLMIEIDDISYGWKNEYAFYGNELFGEGKSIVIQKRLEQGNHSLKLWSNHSPAKTCVLIYRTDQEPSSLHPDTEQPVLPGQTTLHSNYPNPFNAGTTISFDLSNAQDVTLSVFNILGQKIDTIHQGWLETGRHRYFWSARDSRGRMINSGVYYYKLQTRSSMIAKKMLLLQ